VTRIVSGTARGRRLAVPSSGTRPTSDRVREALFSSLDSSLAAEGVAWADVDVLDLYAGSGALGLEALSRGARSAVLVERSRPAAKVLAANVDAVGCPGAVVLVRDALDIPATTPAAPARIVLVDPPYEVAAAAIGRLLDRLHAAGWIAVDAWVVVERPARDEASPIPAAWGEPLCRTYGDTVLWYGRADSQGGI
jgi:16S rRNA (guanine966-N2)-methyltransferase